MIDLIKELTDNKLISGLIIVFVTFLFLRSSEMKKETVKESHKDYKNILLSLNAFKTKVSDFFEVRKKFKEKYDQYYGLGEPTEQQTIDREQSLDEQDNLFKSLDQEYNEIQEILNRLSITGSYKLRIFIIKCEMGLISIRNKIAHFIYSKIHKIMNFVWKMTILIGVYFLKKKNQSEI